jgi:rod shape-determining protein MreC
VVLVKAPHQWTVLLVVVLVLVFGWLVLDTIGSANPIRDSLTQVISPMQLVVSRAAQPLTNVLGGLGRGAALVRESDELKQEIAYLRSQVILLGEAQIENESLRRQLEFKQAVPNYQLIAAEIIGRDPSNYLRYLIIDRGLEDGIRDGMPVLTEAGLVGRISKASQNASQVILLDDSLSAVSAYIQRSRATGVVQGRLGSELEMRYILQNETVVVGDVILTSGLGGNFPKGLVVGQVVEVERNDIDMFQKALIAPAVDLQRLETVMVLMNFQPGEIAADE